jgi:hypothetical protein
MKPKIEIEETYIFTAGNRCVCRGQYYAEDDWSLSGTGSSLVKAIEDSVRDFFSGGSYFGDLNNAYFSKGESVRRRQEIIKLEGKVFRGSFDDFTTDVNSDFIWEVIRNSPAWKKAQAELLEEQKKYRERLQAEQDEKDRELYKELHAKFGGNEA